MPNLEFSIVVRAGGLTVYEILKNPELFPQFMKKVKKIDVIEKKADRLVACWAVDIGGESVFWKEEEVFDDAHTTMDFTLMEGDYADYRGKFSVVDHGDRSTLNLSVSFDWGVPVFEIFVGAELLRKAEIYLKSMLFSIKKKAENNHG